MKSLLAAALLVAAPGAARAALVTYDFAGATTGGSAVAFSITFDTAALAAAGNQATGGAIDYAYSGPTPGLATLAVTGGAGLPTFLTSGVADQSIQFGAFANEITLGVSATTGSGPQQPFSSLTLSASQAVPTASVGGVLLPVLAGVPLFFNAESFDGRTRSQVAGTARLAAVPEPAAWATMVVGLGLVGGALRRRRPMLAGA